MKVLNLLLTILAIITIISCGALKQTEKVYPAFPSAVETDYQIAFYNVENLFDTDDDPQKKDDEFTPDSKKAYTEARYNKKLAHLSKVVEAMEYPDVLGLCEVENAKVLEDWTNHPKMKESDYNYVHFESPDVRGIDVALMFKKSFMQVLNKRIIRINFPKEIVEDYTTRDVLLVEGLRPDNQTFYFFINHWPSRRGGLEASEPKRRYVAKKVRTAVDSVLSINENAGIFIMGDYNDETNFRSVEEVLEARTSQKFLVSALLYNMFAQIDASDKGTYNYRGNWNQLDQIIVSGNLLNNKLNYQVSNPENFQRDWMMYKDPKKGPTPSKTYGGPNYYGGYSDHLPVRLTLKQK